MLIKRNVPSHIGLMVIAEPAKVLNSPFHFVTFEQEIVMYQCFVEHVHLTLAAGASARRINSLLMPGIGLKE